MIFWLLRCIILLFLLRRIDGQLLSLWDGSETYFVRSIARLSLLNSSLQNPSKDLGPSAIERCRGFAVHLMVNVTVMYLHQYHYNATTFH
jgi:hypothetical protein